MASDKSTSYPERALLTDLIGDRVRGKVLAVLLKEAHRDHTAKDIAEMADVHRSSVYPHLHELQEIGFVESRKVGRTHLYQINKDSEVAQSLKQTEETLINEVDA